MTDEIVWSAKEAMAAAYCWAEFAEPESVKSSPEAYWLSISEKSRNECRSITNSRLLVAVARGQAVAVLPWEGIPEKERQRFIEEVGLKSNSRARKILYALHCVFKRNVREVLKEA